MFYYMNITATPDQGGIPAFTAILAGGVCCVGITVILRRAENAVFCTFSIAYYRLGVVVIIQDLLRPYFSVNGNKKS